MFKKLLILNFAFVMSFLGIMNSAALSDSGQKSSRKIVQTHTKDYQKLISNVVASLQLHGYSDDEIVVIVAVIKKWKDSGLTDGQIIKQLEILLNKDIAEIKKYSKKRAKIITACVLVCGIAVASALLYFLVIQPLINRVTEEQQRADQEHVAAGEAQVRANQQQQRADQEHVRAEEMREGLNRERENRVLEKQRADVAERYVADVRELAERDKQSFQERHEKELKNASRESRSLEHFLAILAFDIRPDFLGKTNEEVRQKIYTTLFDAYKREVEAFGNEELAKDKRNLHAREANAIRRLATKTLLKVGLPQQGDFKECTPLN